MYLLLSTHLSDFLYFKNRIRACFNMGHHSNDLRINQLNEWIQPTAWQPIPFFHHQSKKTNNISILFSKKQSKFDIGLI